MVLCQCGAAAGFYVCVVVGRELSVGSETDYVDGYVCAAHVSSGPEGWLLGYPLWSELERETSAL